MESLYFEDIARVVQDGDAELEEARRGNRSREGVLELVLGRQTFKTGLSDPITEEMVQEYFRLTGDRFFIHSDAAFARRFGFRSMIVPGNLVVALSSGLMYRDGPFRESLLVQSHKDTEFRSPLYIGERIYVVDRVIGIEDRIGKPYGKVDLTRETFSHDDRCITVSRQGYRVLKRDSIPNP